MDFWLVKSEPGTYSWDDMSRDKVTRWDGVRNYQARNYLREMKVGDRVFFYHSGKDKSIVGTVLVKREAYPDPEDGEWSAVDIGIEGKLMKPVSLEAIKKNKSLSGMALLRMSRLSVQPVTPKEFELIEGMGHGPG